jgi:hypothetical protein
MSGMDGLVEPFQMFGQPTRAAVPGQRSSQVFLRSFYFIWSCRRYAYARKTVPTKAITALPQATQERVRFCGPPRSKNTRTLVPARYGAITRSARSRRALPICPYWRCVPRRLSVNDVLEFDSRHETLAAQAARSLVQRRLQGPEAVADARPSHPWKRSLCIISYMPSALRNLLSTLGASRYSLAISRARFEWRS